MKNLIDMIAIKESLAAESAYPLFESFWEDTFRSLSGNVSTPYISNTYADGEEIRDGNPIFSTKLADNLGIRIIQTEDSKSETALSCWLNETSIHGQNIQELVISLQFHMETFADARHLILLYLHGILSENVLQGINEKYNLFYEHQIAF